ncbi:MAG: Gfo/Idh/MocA family oxidoreductase [Fibrobacteres bacterium]|nr:Gfo/Idh/MocA family oxidoreductase [Fibrobacterota bacterium]
MKFPKIGIVGAGAISKDHIDGYTKAGATVIAICDPLKAARDIRVKDYNITHSFDSIDELLKIKEIDAVSICSPNSLHAEHTVKALQAGKHVMTEKPMALNVEQAEKMVKAAKKYGKILMCGHNQRFTPVNQKVDEMRANGEFGHVYHAKCAWIRKRGIPGLGGWFTTKALSGGGPLIDIGIHVIDRTWHMMGKPRPVSVSGATYSVFGKNINKYVCKDMWAGPRNPKGKMDVEDFASAFIRFEDGQTMTAEVSWAANRSDEDSWSLIMGEKLGALVKGNSLTLYGERGNSISTDQIDFDPSPYKNRHGHFVDCLVNKVKCTCPGEDGLTMQKLLNAIYKSSEKKMEIKL